MAKTQVPDNCIEIEHTGIYAALYTNPKKVNRWEYIIRFRNNDRESPRPLHTPEDLELYRGQVLTQPRDLTPECCSQEAALELLKPFMRDCAEARLNGLRARIRSHEAEIIQIEDNLGAEDALNAAMNPGLFQNPPAKGSE